MNNFVLTEAQEVKTYIFEVEVMGAPRMTRQDRFMQRDVVMRYKAYGIKIRNQAKKQGFTLKSILAFRFYIPMPQSWSMKRKILMNGNPHQQKPDIDNLVKAFMDAYTYGTELNDGHVWSIKADKFWSIEPRIEVEA